METAIAVCGPLIEDLLAERDITVSREAILLWCIKFGALHARRLERKHRGDGDTFYIDEVFRLWGRRDLIFIKLVVFNSLPLVLRLSSL